MATASPMRRNRPGTARADLFRWEPYASYGDIDSTHRSQEYIQQLIRQSEQDPSAVPIEKIIEMPVTVDPDDAAAAAGASGGADDASGGSSDSDASVDGEDGETNAWIYEQFRQLLVELNAFVLHHRDVCTKESQPEMKISAELIKSRGASDAVKALDEKNQLEDLTFLCAAFDPIESVPAIDYMIHSITQATEEICDPKVFPNRINVSAKGLKEIKKHVRRTYRIFTFSYFVYEGIFREYESRTRLCERFTKLCKKYKLMATKDNYLIPGSIINCESERRKKSSSSSSSKSKDKDSSSGSSGRDTLTSSSSSSSTLGGDEKKKRKSSKSKE